jgi:site-specific DNA-methyltransferase (adenine-specific)
MIYHADCIDILRTLPDGSIDMILQDPPYNMTACSWECVLDLPVLWKEWERVIKDNGAIVMTASQPFTSELVMSNKALFKYEIIFEKDSVTSPFLAKKQIMKRHENILVFYQRQCTFNPQMEIRKEENKRNNNRRNYPTESKGNAVIHGKNTGNEEMTYPHSIQKFNRDKDRGLHPTQKPVDLFRYLIRTYTNEGETVFDGYAGSGTTAVACIKENRKYICCEKETKHIETINKRCDDSVCLYS